MLRLPYEKLIVWQKAMPLVTRIYEIVKTFPPDERFGLVRQMCDAAVSIPSNIAEGSQRTTNKDFANFIRIAKGSLAELRTQVHICCNLKYISEHDRDDLFERIKENDKMLFSLHRKLSEK